MAELNDFLNHLDEAVSVDPIASVSAKMKKYLVKSLSLPGGIEMIIDPDTVEDDLNLTDDEVNVIDRVYKQVSKEFKIFLANFK
jgi:hypothetical protein